MQSTILILASLALAAGALAWALVERGRAVSMRRYRAIFDSSDSVMLLVDPADGEILEANPAARRFYGLAETGAVCAALDSIAVLSSDDLGDRLATARDGQSVFASTHRTAGGVIREVEVHAGPIRRGSETVLFVAVYDASARRLAQIELEQYRRNLESLIQARTAELVVANRGLRQASEAKSAFLANMSHELRTPLNSVIGFSGTMLSGLAGPLTDEQRRQVEMIGRSGRQLLELVDGVLDLSRVESGSLPPVYDRVALTDLAREALGSVAPLARAKGLELRADLTDGDVTVRTDPLKVRQILINLLSNAVKFTDEGEVVLSLEVEGDSVRLAVRDTGPGIPRERHALVFDDFRQFEAPGVAKPAGSGLGLTVSKAMASLIGGRIELRSAVGEGSTFTLVLPMPDGVGAVA